MPPRPDPRRAAAPWRRRLVLLAFLGAAGLALGGCASLYPPEPVTEQGRDINDLYNVVFLFAAAIFVAVEAALLFIVLRYRRGDRRGDGRDDLLPTQTHGHLGVEVLWTVIPFAIVAFLFFISWQALGRVVADPAQSAGVRVFVTGFQWCWTFEYVDEGVTVKVPVRNSKGEICRDENGAPPTLVVPVGERIRLQLHSTDVIHAFYVPQFLSKLDVIPQGNEARDNFFDFTPTAIGEYRGQCAEFCGLFHAEMQLAVSVRSQVDYEAWLTEEKGKPSPTPSTTPPPGATTIKIGADPVQKFDKTSLQAPADTPFVFAFDNRDPGQAHNVAILDAGGNLVFNGQPIVTGPAKATYNVADGLAAGTYRFFCIVHPTTMFGTLEVR